MTTIFEEVFGLLSQKLYSATKASTDYKAITTAADGQRGQEVDPERKNRVNLSLF